MIIVKTKREIQSMKEAGRIAARALQVGGEAVTPGITTKEIDSLIHAFISSQGATPSFLGYNGFPASSCISVNDVVIHGIPGDLVVQEGDLVSVDVGAYFDGFHGDNAATFLCGEVSLEAEKLVAVTRQCFELGMAQAVVGGRIGDISQAVQTHAENNGFGVVYSFVGHGIGRDMHEPPQIPNSGKGGRGPRLAAGMTLAIEPMITLGEPHVYVLEDQWTVKTEDGSLVAHHENTVLVTEDGPVILTQV